MRASFIAFSPIICNTDPCQWTNTVTAELRQLSSQPSVTRKTEPAGLQATEEQMLAMTPLLLTNAPHEMQWE